MAARDLVTSSAASDHTEAPEILNVARKRKRLTHACNRCRARKVRCDERHPDCSNCVVARVRCVTQDPRQPTAVVRRQEAQKRVGSPQDLPNTHVSPQFIALRPDSSVASGSESFSPDGHAPANNSSSVHVPEIDSDDALHERAVSNLPAIPRFAGSSSVYILSQWLDLAFARIRNPQRFYRQYKESHARIEAISSSIPTSSPDEILQQFHDHEVLTSRFLSTINMVFPIFGTTVSKMQHGIPKLIDLATNGTRPDLNLTVHCLLLAAGSIGIPQDGKDLAGQCLRYVSVHLGEIMTSNCLEAVIIFALSAIIYRGRNNSGMAWNMLGLGISMALTLGLNRFSSTYRPSGRLSKPEHQYRRVWLALYILDRTLSIELERPGIIREYDCNYDMSLAICDSSEGDDAPGRDQGRAFQAIYDLAKLQGQLNERLLMSRHIQETGGLTLDEIIIMKMRAAGELDQMLLAWSEQLPQDLRPSEHSFCDPLILPAVSFMAIQFYQTMFLLHRNALIVNAKATQKELEVNFTQAPYRLRLLNGQNICCAAARSIVKLMNDVHEIGQPSALTPIHAPLVALCALSVQILRVPHSGSARADLELQASAIALISRENSRSGNAQDTGLEIFMRNLHSEVSARINDAARPGATQSTTSRNEERSLPVSRLQHGQQTLVDTVAPQFSDFSVQGDWPIQSHEWNFVWDLETGVFGDVRDTERIDWDLLAMSLDLPTQ